MAAPMLTCLKSGLRLCPQISQICRAQNISLTAASQAGSKWRIENGFARSGTEYGPLTDLPDWSYADGRAAPLLKGQIRRKQEMEELARRVVMLSSEVDRGMERWRKTQEEKKKKEGKNLSLLLKSKGDRLLKK
ncbi:39S ribosomal protein L52 [Huso huso]|uniref:Large ribosomal subunit protein mL52 n=1 Tax=Huso huso TaxID=61971 RepID=A0ABR0Y5F2_HUSHU